MRRWSVHTLLKEYVLRKTSTQPGRAISGQGAGMDLGGEEREELQCEDGDGRDCLSPRVILLVRHVTQDQL